ncbi:MAG: PEP-utilizing enzyme [Acidimicrobiales bacterium]
MTDRWITDTDASTRFPVYTRSNANDVLPDPISPLGATLLWIPGVMEGWRDGNVRNGSHTMEELTAEGFNPVCGIFNGFFYVNASSVRVFGVRSGAGAAAIDAAFFGNRPDTPPYVAHPEDDSPEAGARIGAQMGWVMSATDWPELDAHKAQADGARATRPDVSALSDADLVARARSMTPLLRAFFDDHVLSSSNTAVGPTILGQITAGLDPTLMIRLIASSGDVDSALPSYAMWDLSRLVRSSAYLSSAFDAGVSGLLERLRQSSSPDAARFLEQFDRFLELFGSRGPNEWDVFADVWETRPELALSLVERMRQAADDADPSGRNQAMAQDREAATVEAQTALAGNDEALGMLAAAQGSALRFLAWRERTKTNCIKVINEQRVALNELGRRLTAAGHLGEPKQLYMLTDAELDAFRADPAAMRATVEARWAHYQGLREMEPPYFVEGDKGIPPVTALVRKADAIVAVAKAGVGDVLQGGPGCAGKARGRARIVLDPSDPFALEPGDVLIAPQTDPSWTPLFVPAGAVVVDVGAMNSHAVIVSRELGIPCAVGVVDATRRIPDGARVEVDGAAGTVRILELPE